MKKTFTLLCFAFSAGMFAQSFTVYKTTTSGVITATITNNGGFTETTTAGTPNHPSAAIENHVTILNNSASTQTYGVIRTIVSQNPSLILDNSTNTPNTYFCFGNTCFGSATSQADQGNYTILAAAGHTNSTLPYADNSLQNGQPFVIYFNEGNTQGTYVVRYKIYNVNNANDTLAFKVAYNAQLTTGIKNQVAAASDFVSEIYPNPVSGSKIYFNLGKDDEVKCQVYNSLGSLVYDGSKQKFSAGKNQLPVDGADLSSGLYFVTLSGSSATVTKRLIVTGK